jgi:hypothetical protein
LLPVVSLTRGLFISGDIAATEGVPAPTPAKGVSTRFAAKTGKTTKDCRDFLSVCMLWRLRFAKRR